MTLRIKYILFVVVLHVATIVLSFLIFNDNKLFFIASEILILFSAFISWQLYKQLLQPLKTLREGIDAISNRDFNVKFTMTGKHEMDELIQVYNTMIDALRMERTKQEEQHFFLQKLIDTSPTGIIVLDYDNHIQQLNPQAISVLEIEERQVIGKPVEGILHPLMLEVSRLTSGTKKLVSMNGAETYRLQKSHFIDRGFPRYFILMEELTAEMLAAEKKAYGKVIRMMAHEVNNTIGPVNSILQSTLQAEHKNEVINQALQVAIDRNHNLNVFMRNFADIVRLPAPQRKATDLHRLVKDVTSLMQLQASGKDIRIVFDLSQQPFILQADDLQMEQALINIIKNAIEAITTAGTITITSTASPRELIIGDTGKGIDAGDAEQLFSPFFSTKKDGQGIGLTLIREIMINHDFEFSLKTIRPGHTEFRIRFDQA